LRTAGAGASGRTLGAARTGIALGTLVTVVIGIITLLASLLVAFPAVVIVASTRRFGPVMSFIELPFEVILIIFRIPILGQSIHFLTYIDVRRKPLTS
jgi:hypothetical protein